MCKNLMDGFEAVMKTLIKLFLVACLWHPLLTRAGYGNNPFFVTLEPGTTNLIAGAIANARTNIECQPEEKDKEGHWGNKVTGLQLSLRFPKSVYQANEPIDATIIYRNTRQDSLMVCRWVYGGDDDFGFVVRDENGNRLRDSFVPYNTSNITSVWWPPGTQYIYQSNLAERFGLTNPGTYSITVYRRLPNTDLKFLEDLYSTAVTITIAE